MCQERVGRWSEARVKIQPPGYLGFTQADPISSYFSLKSASPCAFSSVTFKAKRRAPSVLCTLPGLHGSGPACSWGG